MLKRLRRPEPFGKAGLMVAICALLLALVGGAYAAGGLTKTQEKQVTKIAKKYAGTPGAPGATGAAGTNGTNGKDGANGTNGAPGEKGTNGTNGKNGKSVTTGPAPVGSGAGECEAGGTVVEVEGVSSEVVCNGLQGEPGETGFTEHLPIGATETGVWSAWGKPTSILGGGFMGLADPISFNIPLASSPEVNFILSDGTEQFTHKTAAEVGCPGTAESPAAETGKLCIFVGPFEENVFKNSEGETRYADVELVPARLGVVIVVSPVHKATEEEEEEVHILSGGSWAVGGN